MLWLHKQCSVCAPSEELKTSRVCIPFGFCIFLDGSPRDIIHTVWLTAEWRISNKWHCTAAISGLWSHGVDTNDHSDDTAIEEEEPKHPDGDDGIEEDRMIGLPFNITILINMGGRTSCAGSDQNHHELDQKRPCGHVHAILAPTLRSALAVSEHQCAHTGTHEENCQHRAEHHDALAVLHSLC